MDKIKKPPISMNCNQCNEIRTFHMSNEYFEAAGYVNASPKGESIRAVYVCSYCTNFSVTFFLKISENSDWICKVGQFPPWTVISDKNIQSMLGDHKELIKKGLVCESQSYGVGAFAYYRRIVEEIIDGMLDGIFDLISPEEKIKYADVIDATKKTRVTSEKIELVKDMLPAILRPDGMNPLALLHGVLSEGLHADTDEKCLALAVEIRQILTFLASQVATSKLAAQSFTDGMRSLLDKRAANIAMPTDRRPRLG
jgi:hypothetical protein